MLCVHAWLKPPLNPPPLNPPLNPRSTFRSTLCACAACFVHAYVCACMLFSPFPLCCLCSCAGCLCACWCVCCLTLYFSPSSVRCRRAYDPAYASFIVHSALADASFVCQCQCSTCELGGAKGSVCAGHLSSTRPCSLLLAVSSCSTLQQH